MSFVIFVVGTTFLAGAQIALYPGQGMKGFDVKAALDALVTFVAQNYLIVLLGLAFWIYVRRRDYVRGFQDGRAAERAHREELRRKFGHHADNADADGITFPLDRR